MASDVIPGVRVVRGPDWKWGDQDGGEGHVGTVVEVGGEGDQASSGGVVLVQWDNGNRYNYRCGIEGKHDLRIYDNSPVCIIHGSIICDSCRENGIKGMRWKCTKCYDFDLCTTCYMGCKHSLNHEFQRIDSNDSPKILLSNRISQKRIQAKGLFLNAEVSRGHDWIWGDQDGGVQGSKGRIDAVKGWSSDSYNSVAEVKWYETKRTNVYRIGHKGKVDIKADTPSDGLLYFPSHLPVLGKRLEQQQHSEQSSPKQSTKLVPTEEHKNEDTFVTGDLVRVQLDLDLFKVMQEGHGGWNEDMMEILTLAGTVKSILENGDIQVSFGSRMWTINPASLAKVAKYSKGDVVRVIDDMSTVCNQQAGHGDWVDDMALSLGQVGRVAKVFPTGDCRVSVNGRTWTFNPLNLNPAPGESPPDVSSDADGDIEDMDMRLKLLSLLEDPAVVVAAAANGDAKVVRDFLTKHPKEVNAVAAGKAAVHCAAVAGNLEVLNCLIEFNANMEIQDEDGDTPLHLCAYGNEEEAAKLVMDTGANVNALNYLGATPLIIAAAKGHGSVVNTLLQSPNIDLSLQDCDGNNALHHGVVRQWHTVVSALLSAGFDMELVNFKLFTPVHEAAKVGFLPAMEMFIRHKPSCVNLQKDDGYTPLHLAALNNHLEVLTTILDSDECNIDSVTSGLQTALHIAVHQGHGSIVERLVGFGANLNMQDKDGDTALHIALVRETLATISADAPRMQKVRKNFNMEDSSASDSAVIACFLVQEGADLYLQNNKGNGPLVICSPAIAALVTKFVDDNQRDKSTFHGSLCPTKGKGGLLATSQNSPPIVSVAVSKTEQQLELLSPGASSESTATASATIVCVLCDEKVEIVLRPCNHTSICIECSRIAKKCPECKGRITSIEPIQVPVHVPKCSLCEEEEATVTLEPCGHKYCPDCSSRIKRCAECKAPIKSKAGPIKMNTHNSHSDPVRHTESAEPAASSTQPSSSQSALCEICCERPRNTALTCGHQFCYECSNKVNNCPVCRKFIQHRIQLYL